MFKREIKSIFHSWGAAVVLLVGLATPILCQSLNDVRFNSVSIINPARSYDSALNDISEEQSDLILQEIIFKVLKLSNLSNDVDQKSAINPSERIVVPKVNGEALFYPNPFRLSEGSELGYELSDNFDIDIRLYDMRGYEIYSKTFSGGTPGAIKGYNKVAISPSTFDNRRVSSGIYFFLILHGDSVLAKGKFAVRP